MTQFLRAAFFALALLALPRPAAAYVESAALSAPFSDTSPAANEARTADGRWQAYRQIGGDAGWLARDRSVFFAVGTGDDPLPPFTLAKGQLRIVLFLGRGTPVAGGVSVGAPASEAVRAFGPVYPYSRSDVYENEPGTGLYTENTHAFPRSAGRPDFRYYTLTYRDRDGRSLQFLVDRETKTVAAAAYWEGASLSRPDAAAADALTRWGLWRYLFPASGEAGALRL